MQLFGASAALTTSGLGFAATTASAAQGSKPILDLGAVAIAWPVYHRLITTEDMPEIGSPVFLERDVRHPSGDRGIAVHMQSGEKTLGFITNQNHAALDWALQRAGSVDARIAKVDEPVVRGMRVPGWGAFHISVKVWEGAAAV